MSGYSHMSKEWALESSVESGAHVFAVADSVFPHLLQALDCIAQKGIISQRVASVNSSFVLRLRNCLIDATTFAGTKFYMAPETFRKGR